MFKCLNQCYTGHMTLRDRQTDGRVIKVKGKISKDFQGVSPTIFLVLLFTRGIFPKQFQE